MGRWGLALIVGLGLSPGCQGSAGSFACNDDAQCGADGTCQPTGYCSFPDTTCPSQQRYGGLAGDRLADTCVPEEALGGTGSSTSVPTTTMGSSSTTSASSVTAGEISSTTDPTDSQTGTSDESTSGPDEPVDLVVWYAFEEVVDDVVEDASGNGIDAGCEACGPSLVGVEGNALTFSTLESVLVAKHDLRMENPAFTVSVWMRQTATECMSIASKPLGASDANSWQLYTCPSQSGEPNLVGFISGAGDSTFMVPYAFDPINFVHVAFSFDKERVRLYMGGDRLLERAVPHEMQYEEGPLLVGGEDNGQGLEFPFQGALDEFRLYGRALSDDEIAALASER
ncbi:MAG: LamG domain-containing protein [Myxococcota bacterium]